MIHVFANMPVQTYRLDIDMFDWSQENECVWRIGRGEDVRYIQGHKDDEVWDIVAQAAKAYEEE